MCIGKSELKPLCLLLQVSRDGTVLRAALEKHDAAYISSNLDSLLKSFELSDVEDFLADPSRDFTNKNLTDHIVK